MAPGLYREGVDPERLVKISKWMAKHLRHQPERIGLELDEAGWAAVDQLLDQAAAHRFPFTRAELEAVVATNNKARYELDASGSRIRARQGHTIAVDLGLEARPPPTVLYHGTAEATLPAILAEGLRPMRRQHVHLSVDVATAVTVGRRHGRPVVLEVAAGALAAAGTPFWLSTNGVWLTDGVPASHLRRLDPP
jgi:putative RNA 2'-phosphotransferase